MRTGLATGILAISLFLMPPGVNGNSYAYRTHSKSRDLTTGTKKLESAGVTKHHKRLWQYKRKHLNYYSLQDDIAIGERFLKAQKKAFEKKGLAVNPARYEKTRRRIEKIVNRLAKVSDIPNLPYEVVILEKDDVANAYCLPGGKIGVFTGLFDKKEGLIDQNNDDEIAAVLSHEIAHATMRHVTRGLTTYQNVGLISSLLTAGISRGLGQNWGYLARQIFNTGTFLYLPSYSRKHEKEADQVGFYYMARAGFDPKAAIMVWERASQKRREQGQSDKTQFFSTHPASGKRAAFLKGYLDDAYEVKRLEGMKRKMRQ